MEARSPSMSFRIGMTARTPTGSPPVSLETAFFTQPWRSDQGREYRQRLMKCVSGLEVTGIFRDLRRFTSGRPDLCRFDLHPRQMRS
jgi:hypothetical protein